MATSPVIYDDAPLRERVKNALADDFKHNAIKSAQETIVGNRDKCADANPLWEELRWEAAYIRNHVLENLDYYIREFAKNAQAAGAQVHFAPTAEDAVECALDIFEEAQATRCVKSKSMVTEEVGLNEYLEKHGIHAVETDCAENILQTAGSKPSHIVVPALHFNRDSIRDLYREKKGYSGSNSPEEITKFLRSNLREEFLSAKVGVTGCNFGVAETGSCTLVTNEGNARMATTVPETQIVMMGAERIVPDLRSLDTLVALLVPSAVGSKITSSFQVNTGAAKPGEADGPTKVHIIMVDNGRSKILASEFRSMLRCIRCGACMNNCPVYRHITGHGYGSIYPGPMGVVLTPLLEGYRNTDKLPYACSLCGACDDMCPVRIPLHRHIHKHKINLAEGGHVSSPERATFDMAGKVLSNRFLYDVATGSGSRGMKVLGGAYGALGLSTTWIPVLRGWTSSRDMDLMAKERFRNRFAKHVPAAAELDENGMTAADRAEAARQKAAAGAHAPAASEPRETSGAAGTEACTVQDGSQEGGARA